MCGKDQPVKDFLRRAAEVGEMIDDIVGFLERWIPYYQNFQRPYLTIAIGCTGGQHRSVYIAEEVARRLSTNGRPVQTRHHELRLPVMRSGGSSG
jgi:UPF0042 nucleotide-binding protein